MAAFCIMNTKSLNSTGREITITYARASILAAKILILRSQPSKETSIMFICPKHISCEGSSPLGLMCWILNYLDNSSYTYPVEMPTRKGGHRATNSMVTDGWRASKHIPLNRSRLYKLEGTAMIWGRTVVESQIGPSCLLQPRNDVLLMYSSGKRRLCRV